MTILNCINKDSEDESVNGEQLQVQVITDVKRAPNLHKN